MNRNASDMRTNCPNTVEQARISGRLDSIQAVLERIEKRFDRLEMRINGRMNHIERRQEATTIRLYLTAGAIGLAGPVIILLLNSLL